MYVCIVTELIPTELIKSKTRYMPMHMHMHWYHAYACMYASMHACMFCMMIRECKNKTEIFTCMHVCQPRIKPRKNTFFVHNAMYVCMYVCDVHACTCMYAFVPGWQHQSISKSSQQTSSKYVTCSTSLLFCSQCYAWVFVCYVRALMMHRKNKFLVRRYAYVTAL